MFLIFETAKLKNVCLLYCSRVTDDCTAIIVNLGNVKFL